MELTKEELGVIRLMFDDQTESDISMKLEVPVVAVHGCIEEIYRKLGVRDRVQLVMCLMEEAARLEAGENGAAW